MKDRQGNSNAGPALWRVVMGWLLAGAVVGAAGWMATGSTGPREAFGSFTTGLCAGYLLGKAGSWTRDWWRANRGVGLEQIEEDIRAEDLDRLDRWTGQDMGIEPYATGVQRGARLDEELGPRYYGVGRSAPGPY